MLLNTKTTQQQAFFSAVSSDMFSNVAELFEQIDAQFTGRSVDESVGAQMAAFCVYVCGLFSTYLCLYPNLCPDPAITRQGPAMVKRTREILSECDRVWPLASRWTESLDRAYNQPHQPPLMSEGGMTDSKDPVPQAWLKRSNSTPPGERGNVPSTTNSESHANKMPAPIDTVMTAYATPQPRAEMLQHQHQPVPMFHQTGAAFPAVALQEAQAPQSTAVPFSPHSHIPTLIPQPPPEHMYISPQHPPENMAMMMASSFQPNTAAPHAPPPQHQGYMINQPIPGGYQQTGPGNDGFEDELQVYMGGKEGRFLPPDWSGPY